MIELWRDCGLVVPQNDPHKDIARKMQINPELFIVGEATLVWQQSYCGAIPFGG